MKRTRWWGCWSSHSSASLLHSGSFVWMLNRLWKTEQFCSLKTHKSDATITLRKKSKNKSLMNSFAADSTMFAHTVHLKKHTLSGAWSRSWSRYIFQPERELQSGRIMTDERLSRQENDNDRSQHLNPLEKNQLWTSCGPAFNRRPVVWTSARNEVD